MSTNRKNNGNVKGNGPEMKSISNGKTYLGWSMETNGDPMKVCQAKITNNFTHDVALYEGKFADITDEHHDMWTFRHELACTEDPEVKFIAPNLGVKTIKTINCKVDEQHRGAGKEFDTIDDVEVFAYRDAVKDQDETKWERRIDDLAVQAAGLCIMACDTDDAMEYLHRKIEGYVRRSQFNNVRRNWKNLESSYHIKSLKEPLKRNEKKKRGDDSTKKMT